MVEPSDEHLMARFLEGDQGAFEALFGRYAGRIRGYLRRLCGSDAQADDLTQVTFLSMVNGRGRFLPGARVRPWLYAIATNAARDARRRGRLEALGDEDVPEAAADEAAPDPLLQRALSRALAELPEAQREAIVLHRCEGLSFAEIAELAGVTESAVKVRAHRGSERLRELLKGAWP